MSKSDLDALLKELDDPSGISWKDETYDLARARLLDGADRSEYVSRLIEHAEQADARAAMTLGEIGATEAVDTLLAISQRNAENGPAARRALVKLGRGADVLPDLARDAQQAPSRNVRAAAVMALGQIGGAAAIAALESCLDDSDAIVRGLAVDALIDTLSLRRYTLNADGEQELRTPLQRMSVLIGSDSPALVDIGRDELRAALASIRNGSTPEQAGLGWTPTMALPLRAAMTATLVDEDAALPVDEVERVTGADRRWAEALFALALEKQDIRAPKALAALGARWTVPALEAAARSAEAGNFREAVQDAIHLLKS